MTGPLMTGPPIWASGTAAHLTIDLGALVDNYRRIARTVAPAAVAGVVKADAYGLGLIPVARALHGAGCRLFFVAHVEEALELRHFLPSVEIAVLNGLPPGTEAAYVGARLIPVLNHLGEIESWQGVCRREGRRLPGIVHVDTGMNRLGLGPDELARLIAEPDRLDGIARRALITHLASGDDPGGHQTQAQYRRFVAARAKLPKMPASLANSPGSFRGRHLNFDLVRPGSAVYGINPTPEAANPVRRVVSVEARLLQVRNVETPMTVGYGATYTVPEAGRIGTVALGYADGYLRSLSGKGAVFIDGRRCPVVGRVSMDLITVDMTHVPEAQAEPGRLVEIIGDNQSPDDVADQAGTIGYEILTSLGSRYHRRYIDPADAREADR